MQKRSLQYFFTRFICLNQCSYILGGYPIRAYDSLQKVCQTCGLDRPQDITSTNMRKYMATLAQVLYKLYH
jgi:hypothetical protein